MATETANGRTAEAVDEVRHDPHPHPDLLDRVVAATRQERYTIRDVEIMARHAARSRLYGMDESQAFTLMMLADAEGLHPIQAVRRFHVIKGRPSMRADAMQAEFQRHGGCLRWLETTDEACVAEAWHPVKHPEHLTFPVTLKELVDSRVACVWEGNERTGEGEWRVKDMYTKYPGRCSAPG